MADKYDVRKVSMWADGPTLTYAPAESAWLLERDDHYKLKLKRPAVRKSDLPDDDPVDYCITVTTEAGDHYHGEVSNLKSGYWYKFEWPKPDPFAIASP